MQIELDEKELEILDLALTFTGAHHGFRNSEQDESAYDLMKKLMSAQGRIDEVEMTEALVNAMFKR